MYLSNLLKQPQILQRYHADQPCTRPKGEKRSSQVRDSFFGAFTYAKKTGLFVDVASETQAKHKARKNHSKSSLPANKSLLLAPGPSNDPTSSSAREPGISLQDFSVANERSDSFHTAHDALSSVADNTSLPTQDYSDALMTHGYMDWMDKKYPEAKIRIPKLLLTGLFIDQARANAPLRKAKNRKHAKVLLVGTWELRRQGLPVECLQPYRHRISRSLRTLIRRTRNCSSKGRERQRASARVELYCRADRSGGD